MLSLNKGNKPKFTENLVDLLSSFIVHRGKRLSSIFNFSLVATALSKNFAAHICSLKSVDGDKVNSKELHIYRVSQ